MNAIILGCGVIGGMAGQLLAAAGHTVVGVRRRARPEPIAGCPIITGDIADPALFAALSNHMPRVDVIILSANPGIRRGQDNGLVQAVELYGQHFPNAALIYTGTTSVFADAQGAGVDENGPIDRNDPNTAALMAIEDAVMRHAQAIILRATAIVGPTRTFAQKKCREAAANGQPCIVAGNIERPFSYIHEHDLAELVVAATTDKLPPGIYNTAAPERLTVRDYYLGLAAQAGVHCSVVSDGTTTSSRWIDAVKLHKLLPEKRWRSAFARE
jgi:nucleoside-diphosphate-sugar epimerase